jgi:cation:H+ antiporter
MSPFPVLLAVFALAALVSIATSGVLVVRLERVAHRLDLTEAALGLLAALAADAPEITSSVTALIHHDQGVGVGIVVGSNIFNIAALLGVAALIADSLPVSRALSIYDGVPAIALAGLTALFLARLLPAWLTLSLVLLIVVPYGVIAVRGPSSLRGESLMARTARRALQEETSELDEIVPPTAANRRDVVVAVVAVSVVVVASALMERSGVRLGAHFHLSPLVIGALVLAAVTSIPNVVAAVYLARRRRPAALISEASNSNTLNVLCGMAIPAVLAGARFAGSADLLIGCFYVGLTTVAYGAIWAVRGMRRSMGLLVIAGYICFVVVAVLD